MVSHSCGLSRISGYVGANNFRYSKPHNARGRQVSKLLKIATAFLVFRVIAAAIVISANLQGTAQAQTDGDTGNQEQGESQSPAAADPAATEVERPAPTDNDANAVPVIDPLSIEAKTRQNIEAIEANIKQIQATLQRDSLNDVDLSKLRDEVTPLSEQAQAISESLKPRAQAIQQRLDRLGAPPADGEPAESASVASDREAQNALLTQIQGAISRTQLLSVTASQLAAGIAQRRRTLFSDRIFERRNSIFSPQLWDKFFTAMPVAASRFSLLLNDWGGVVRDKFNVWIAIALASLIGIAFLLVQFARKIARTAQNQWGLPAPVAAYTKISRAVWVMLSVFLIPTLTMIAMYFVMDGFGLLPARVGTLAQSEVENFALFFLALGLLFAYLSPRAARWRIAWVGDRNARLMFVIMISAVAIYAIDDILDQLITILFAPLTLSIGKGVIASIAIACLYAMATRTIGQIEARNFDNEDEAVQKSLPVPIKWRWLQIVCGLAVVAIPLSAALGYLSLAHFIATQIVIATIILATIALLMMYVDAALLRGIGKGGSRSMAEKLANTLGTSRERMEQFAIVLNGILRIFLILLAVAFLLVPWGFETKDIFGWVRTAFFGFSIGEINISLSSVLQGLVIFLAGVFVTRAVQRWFETRYLPYTRLDAGVQNSLRTGLGYIGIIIAGAVTITFLGFDMSNIAIVAGALSLGIGFGLQSIVNNFVSGLILLAERPIKSGDWIVVGSDEGYVRKISVRSTEIETFDRATVIVPNSNLISGVVTNWMHDDNIGRVHITIGVGYDSDPEQVQDILMDVVAKHPETVAYPVPRVYFMDFGDNALIYEIRVHLRQVDFGLIVKSELRTEILKRLRAADIQIPYPQRDIHHHFPEDAKSAKAKLPAKKPARKRPAQRRVADGGDD